MTLPNWESAFVQQQKLTEYLLSETHPIGKSKAFLLGILGYDINNAERLSQGLLAIANSGDLTETVTSEYGTKYIIEGTLQSPSGRTVLMRTVWITEGAGSRPRFVTAYPA